MNFGPQTRRSLAVARNELALLCRDRMTTTLLITVPVLQLLLFGFAIQLQPRQVPVAISPGLAAGDALALQGLIAAEAPALQVVGAGLRSGNAEFMVRSGRAKIAFESVPEQVGGAVVTPHSWHVVVDMSDPQAVAPALATLQTGYWRLQATAAGSSGAPLSIQALYNPTGRSDWVFVPSLIGVTVMISMLLMGALCIVRERERGTWESLLASPLGPAAALAGKAAPYLLAGCLQALLVLVTAVLAFDLPARASLWSLLLLTPLFVLAHLALGMLISARAASQLQAMQGAVAFYLPSMLLSGFLFPFDSMPAWARLIGTALPLTHYLRASRDVLLREADAMQVLSHAPPILAFLLVLAVATRLGWRSRLQ